MKNLAVWFEIPVNDFERARKFYNEIMKAEIKSEKMGEEMMGFFQMEGYNNNGAIVKFKEFEPSDKGVLVYLNGGEDLNEILNRVEPAGGKIVRPKTLISEKIGYYALFLDTEGNRIGLHSMK